MYLLRETSCLACQLRQVLAPGTDNVHDFQLSLSYLYFASLSIWYSLVLYTSRTKQIIVMNKEKTELPYWINIERWILEGESEDE